MTSTGGRAGRRWRTLATLAAALAGTSCGTTKHAANGLDCLPKQAAKWLAGPDVASGFEGRAEVGGPVSLYVDGSGSMTGYIHGATEGRKPFQDLVESVPDMFEGKGSTVNVKLFGSRIQPVSAARRGELSHEGLFACRGVAAADCDNKETRLDLVLRDVEVHPDALAIVITDLWFSDPASATSGLVPLSPPLERILASGRSIAVYGIPAPFDGTVYDLPGGASTRFTGTKPLMMLAVGQPGRVADFNLRLARSSSSMLASGFGDGSIQQALFTLDPAVAADSRASEISPGGDPRVRPAAVLEALAGVRVPQFRIDRGEAIRRTAKAGMPPSWTGPRDADFVPHAVWRGPLATREVVWRRRDKQCRPADWEPPTVSTDGWRAGERAGEQRFALDPTGFVERFRRPGTYLVTGEVARTSLDQPNPATDWLRAWSFDVNSQDGRTQDGTTFRTLHLSEFARILENALATSAERRPGPISGFTLVVEVKG